MDDLYKPSDVLLVGSIPLGSAKEVFTTASSKLPQRLLAIPDGETGERFNYIGWQKNCFPLETVLKQLGGTEIEGGEFPQYTLDDVKPTGYDDAALASYAAFKELRAKQLVPNGIAFQVCLPTPLNSVQGHTRPEFHEKLDSLYEERIRQSVLRIVREIPHEDMVIQWDLCFDVIAIEFERGRIRDERFRAYFSPVMEGILERVQRLCALIPPTVRVGFHLCYGDLKHKHFVEPLDCGLLVELANKIASQVREQNSLAWIHIPVPKSRIDEAYFEPLKLSDIQETRLFLGVVHANDESGTQDRICTASRVYGKPFGIATECGMGRTPRDELASILAISKAVTEPRGASRP